MKSTLKCYSCNYKTSSRKNMDAHVVSPEHLQQFQGGFSNDVFKSSAFQGYISSMYGVFGYIGNGDRNLSRDIVLERVLRDTGLEANGIATWLTSGDGRHLMDSVDEDTSLLEFTAHAEEYCKDAYARVTVWSHPDHKGNLKSSREIANKIKEVFGA